MNSSNLEQMTALEKMKVKIMEKDKVIFKNRQKEQELNMTIEKLTSELNNQNGINQELNSKIQNLEKNLNKKNNDYNELNEENVQLTNKVNELNEIILNKENEIESNNFYVHIG